MNIYWRELRFMSSSFFIWTTSLLLITLMFLALYPSFSNDIETSKRLLSGLPPAVQSMFGLSLSVFFTVLGYFAYTFTYIALIGSVQAMNLGVGLLSREESAQTTEFLLTKPVKRSTIFVAKLAASLTILTMTSLLFTLITYSLARLFIDNEFDTWRFFGLCAMFYVLQLWFLGLGILVSQLVKRVKSVVSLSLVFVFSFFIIGLIGELVDKDKVRFLTPFKYFDYLNFVSIGTVEINFVIITGLGIIATILVGAFIYTRHDARVF